MDDLERDVVSAYHEAGTYVGAQRLLMGRGRELKIDQVKRVLARTHVHEALGILRNDEILSDVDCQVWLSRVVRGDVKETRCLASGAVVESDAKMSDRLKALELLGRSRGLFVDRKEISGTFTLAQLAAEIDAYEVKQVVDSRPKLLEIV